MPTLNWIGKDKVINHHLDVPFRTLKKEFTFAPNGSDDGNMIIHGDNLEALKSLLPQYEGRVRCIYIDPPYNTGNENWVYNDNVNDPRIQKWLGKVVGAEGEDLSRHDKWLCMMYPRLRLLQKMLANDGAIFISIDSVELYTLKMICDEIFGLSNFVDCISWFKKASPSNDAQYFSNDIEYILIYAKNKDVWKPKRLPLTEKQLKNYQNPDNDPRGRWNSATYTCNKSKSERPNLYYGIINPNTGKETFPKETAVWKYGKEQTSIYEQENRLYWGADGCAQFPRIKKFLFEHEGVVNRTLWHYDDVNHTQGASLELKELGFTGFATPKPSRLIERILNIASDPDSIILDSFAGSGTTAHAVLNMNKADGGHRQFILVEMGDYADSITAERVRRVINGYGEGKGSVEGTGGSFSFYELGEPVFLQDGSLNPETPPDDIRSYVYYSETREALGEQSADDPYWLGTHENVAYYFCYNPDQTIVLSDSLLGKLHHRAEQYVIYADICAISEADLKRWNIVFKKIPRDITRF